MYRLLDNGEKVKATDEMYHKGTNFWERVKRHKGKRVNGAMLPIRRKLKDLPVDPDWLK